MVQPVYFKVVELSITPVTLKYLKIVPVPVVKLPLWHPSKGAKAWILTSDVFVN